MFAAGASPLSSVPDKAPRGRRPAVPWVLTNLIPLMQCPIQHRRLRRQRSGCPKNRTRWVTGRPGDLIAPWSPGRPVTLPSPAFRARPRRYICRPIKGPHGDMRSGHDRFQFCFRTGKIRKARFAGQKTYCFNCNRHPARHFLLKCPMRGQLKLSYRNAVR